MSSNRAVLLALGVAAALPAAAPRLPEKYDRWLNQEVVYVITDEERREFLGLASDDARDRFLEAFWRGRSPSREEHYRRLEYANRTFGRDSNTPGWKTDMGRAYILFGPPQSRTPFSGYGQLYPLELWFYSNSTGNPSLPPFFHLLFYLPDGIGEYRFYRPFVDGPLKLVRGTQFRTNRDVYQFLKPLGGDLARAAFSLIPNEPIDTQDFTTSVASDLLVSKIQNFANDPFQLERVREGRRLREAVTAWLRVYQDQPLEVASLAVTDAAGLWWLDYAVRIGEEALGRREEGNRLRLRLSYTLKTAGGELIFEDSAEGTYPAYEEGRFRPFLLLGRLPLTPGVFRLEIEATHPESGRTWCAERIIETGPPDAAWLSGPVLAAGAYAAQADPRAPFQYFGAQFAPAVERQFAAQESLLLLFQVHAPPAAPRNYRMEYVVGHIQDRTQRRILHETIAAGEFRGGRMLKSKTIALSGLAPGTYRVVATMRPEDSPQVLASSTAQFEIQQQEVSRPRWFQLAGFQTATQAGVAAYLRALEALGLKEEEQAKGFLQEALAHNPANAPAARLLTQIYFRSGQFEQVASLYRRWGLEAFRAAPDTLAQAALSLWRSKDYDGAARILQVAEATFPTDPLVRDAAAWIRRK